MNIGSALSMQFLLSKVETEYTMIFSGHDVLDPYFLKECVQILESRPDITLAFSKVKMINEKREITKQNKYIYSFSNCRLERFFQTICDSGDCSIVQGVFRHKTIENFTLSGIAGIDRLMLNHILWFGNLHIVDRYLYMRRYHRVIDSDENYMKRLTNKNVKRDYSLLIAAYLNDFNSLYTTSDRNKTFFFEKLTMILFKYIAEKRLESFLHKIYAKIRKVISVLPIFKERKYYCSFCCKKHKFLIKNHTSKKIYL